MKTKRFLIALLCLLIPFAIRFLYDNTGFPVSNRTIPTPEYLNLTIPQPPLSTPIPLGAPLTRETGTIIFDVIHNNSYSFAEIEPLTRALTNRGMKIVLNDGRLNLSEHLKRAKAYVVINPTSLSTPDEVNLISAFVKQGGRLLVITDPTRSYAGAYSALYQLPAAAGGSSPASTFSTEVANYLLAPYDIAFQEDYVYNTTSNEGNFRNVIISNIGKNDLTAKINKVVFYSAHSLKTGQSVVLQGDANTYSSITDSGTALPLAAIDSSGRVLVLGDLTFMTQPYDQVADNQQLVTNISNYLVGAAPTRELSDFPYLFNDNLTFLVDPGTAMETRQLTTLSTLQKTYSGYGVAVQVATSPVKGSDILISGVFPPEKSLESYTRPFDLVFFGLKTQSTTTSSIPKVMVTPVTPIMGGGVNKTPTPFTAYRAPTSSARADTSDKAGPMVTVPGFGKISTNGLGLILFTHNTERNVLILLADTKTNLTSLTDMVAAGRLKNCTIVSNIAACSLTPTKTSSGNDSNYSGNEDSGGGYQPEEEAVG